MGMLSKKLRAATFGEGQDGVSFWCPGCQEKHVIRTSNPNGSAWKWNGDAERPTFSPSIHVGGTQPLTEEEYQRVMRGEPFEPKPRVCHSFVTDGRIWFLSDCTHSLAGRTVDLPDLPGHLQDT